MAAKRIPAPQVHAVEPRHGGMEARLLDEQQTGRGGEAAGKRGLARARQYCCGKYHQRRGLGGAVDVGAARGGVGGHDEPRRSGNQRRRHERRCGDQLAGDAAQQSKQSERADTAEPRARAFGVSRPLPFEPHHRAAERGNGERHDVANAHAAAVPFTS